jgi:hypothetical protein
MCLTRQKRGRENIPVKTVIHVNFAAIIAAGYALAKNPVTAKNQLNANLDPNQATVEVQDCIIKGEPLWIV